MSARLVSAAWLCLERPILAREMVHPLLEDGVLVCAAAGEGVAGRAAVVQMHAYLRMMMRAYGRAHHHAALWEGLFETGDRYLAKEGYGHIAVVAVAAYGHEVVGASVGVERWLLTPDESWLDLRRQVALVGSGEAVPVPYARRSFEVGVIARGRIDPPEAAGMAPEVITLVGDAW